MQQSKQVNYNYYLESNLDNYIGEWVIICEGKLVSHDKNLKKAVEVAKEKCGNKKLLIAKIPDKETMIY